MPSLPRSGKVSSQTEPMAKARLSEALTRSWWSGWLTARQPSARIASKVVPV
ncbi:hypothetical protein D3C77_667250 [compost metagenome]